jgi:hypothetical protein
LVINNSREQHFVMLQVIGRQRNKAIRFFHHL